MSPYHHISISSYHHIAISLWQVCGLMKENTITSLSRTEKWATRSSSLCGSSRRTPKALSNPKLASLDPVTVEHLHVGRLLKIETCFCEGAFQIFSVLPFLSLYLPKMSAREIEIEESPPPTPWDPVFHWLVLHRVWEAGGGTVTPLAVENFNM